VLDAFNPSAVIDVDGPTFFESFTEFLLLGIEHIFTGYDHLAFLVGLLIMTTTALGLVKVVTSFTVAHSITLGLATFELLALPPRLIESLIALSIAYIAIENFTGKSFVNRWKITFLFGLVHGFGFSNILREMELTRKTLAISLFSFNAGVEVGQLAFVCVVSPLAYYATKSRWKEHILSAISLCIMSLGFYWFVQRAFL
jgi:hydrogenase/urease accessory protein HupE